MGGAERPGAVALACTLLPAAASGEPESVAPRCAGKLFEMDGSDVIKGGAGRDEVPDGAKRVVAGSGNDKIYLHTGERTTVLLCRGTDTLWYATRDDTCRSIERWRYSRRGC